MLNETPFLNQKGNNKWVFVNIEVAASLDLDYKYLIYRIYGLNTKTRACRINVYEGSVNGDNFKLVSTKVAVYQK